MSDPQGMSNTILTQLMHGPATHTQIVETFLPTESHRVSACMRSLEQTKRVVVMTSGPNATYLFVPDDQFVQRARQLVEDPSLGLFDVPGLDPDIKLMPQSHMESALIWLVVLQRTPMKSGDQAHAAHVLDTIREELGTDVTGDELVDVVKAFMEAHGDAISQLADMPEPQLIGMMRGDREQLEGRRVGFTQKASMAGHDFFWRTGEYIDGRLGEVFLDYPKEGTVLRGLFTALAQAVSLGLQYGVPLDEYVDSFSGVKFEPAGPVLGVDGIAEATSVVDLIFRDLARAYAVPGDHAAPPLLDGRSETLHSTALGDVSLPSDPHPHNSWKELDEVMSELALHSVLEEHLDVRFHAPNGGSLEFGMTILLRYKGLGGISVAGLSTGDRRELKVRLLRRILDKLQSTTST
jgi:hypothetical protein